MNQARQRPVSSMKKASKTLILKCLKSVFMVSQAFLLAIRSLIFLSLFYYGFTKTKPDLTVTFTHIKGYLVTHTEKNWTVSL